MTNGKFLIKCIYVFAVHVSHLPRQKCNFWLWLPCPNVDDKNAVNFNWITIRSIEFNLCGLPFVLFLFPFLWASHLVVSTSVLHVLDPFKCSHKELCLSLDVFHRYLICHFLFPVFLLTDLKLAHRVVYVISRASFAILRLEFGKQRCSFGESVGSAGGSLKRSAWGVFIGGWGVWCPVMLVHFSL